MDRVSFEEGAWTGISFECNVIPPSLKHQVPDLQTARTCSKDAVIVLYVLCCKGAGQLHDDASDEEQASDFRCYQHWGDGTWIGSVREVRAPNFNWFQKKSTGTKALFEPLTGKRVVPKLLAAHICQLFDVRSNCTAYSISLLGFPLLISFFFLLLFFL